MWNARLVSARVDACSTSAAVILGWQCPWFTAEYADRKSRYSFPSMSHSFDPSPRDSTTGSGA